MSYNYNLDDKVLLAVDCIIFGFDGEDLKILLIRRDFEPERGKWSLVGGFLQHFETLDESAIRILNKYTGLDDVYMEQVATFSDINRDPEERTVSTAYYALINIEEHSKKLIHQYSANWFNVSNTPELIFDHSDMIDAAIKRLQVRASTQPIGFELLPEKFTMKQLQKLYEAISNTIIDKRNFINKINSLDIVEKLDEKDKNSSKKGSYLYQFNAKKYKNKKKSDFLLKL